MLRSTKWIISSPALLFPFITHDITGLSGSRIPTDRLKFEAIADVLDVMRAELTLGIYICLMNRLESFWFHTLFFPIVSSFVFLPFWRCPNTEWTANNAILVIRLRFRKTNYNFHLSYKLKTETRRPNEQTNQIKTISLAWMWTVKLTSVSSQAEQSAKMLPMRTTAMSNGKNTVCAMSMPHCQRRWKKERNENTQR